MDKKKLMYSYYRTARTISNYVGKPTTFVIAVSIIIAWFVAGPLFGFSNTYQLIINTFTTIVTFLIVFLIQNTQNRDTHALHMKLDELIRVTKGARKTLINIEGMAEDIAEDLEEIAEDVVDIQQQVAEEEASVK